MKVALPPRVMGGGQNEGSSRAFKRETIQNPFNTPLASRSREERPRKGTVLKKTKNKQYSRSLSAADEESSAEEEDYSESSVEGSGSEYSDQEERNNSKAATVGSDTSHSEEEDDEEEMSERDMEEETYSEEISEAEESDDGRNDEKRKSSSRASTVKLRSTPPLKQRERTPQTGLNSKSSVKKANNSKAISPDTRSNNRTSVNKSGASPDGKSKQRVSVNGILDASNKKQSGTSSIMGVVDDSFLNLINKEKLRRDAGPFHASMINKTPIVSAADISSLNSSHIASPYIRDTSRHSEHQTGDDDQEENSLIVHPKRNSGFSIYQQSMGGKGTPVVNLIPPNNKQESGDIKTRITSGGSKNNTPLSKSLVRKSSLTMTTPVKTPTSRSHQKSQPLDSPVEEEHIAENSFSKRKRESVNEEEQENDPTSGTKQSDDEEEEREEEHRHETQRKRKHHQQSGKKSKKSKSIRKITKKRDEEEVSSSDYQVSSEDVQDKPSKRSRRPSVKGKKRTIAKQIDDDKEEYEEEVKARKKGEDEEKLDTSGKREDVRKAAEEKARRDFGEKYAKDLAAQEELEKRQIMWHLYMMQKAGYPVSKKYTMEDSLYEMRFEYEKSRQEGIIKDKSDQWWERFITVHELAIMVNDSFNQFGIAAKGFTDVLEQKKNEIYRPLRRYYKKKLQSSDSNPMSEIFSIYATTFLSFFAPRILRLFQKIRNSRLARENDPIKRAHHPWRVQTKDDSDSNGSDSEYSSDKQKSKRKSKSSTDGGNSSSSVSWADVTGERKEVTKETQQKQLPQVEAIQSDIKTLADYVGNTQSSLEKVIQIQEARNQQFEKMLLQIQRQQQPVHSNVNHSHVPPINNRYQQQPPFHSHVPSSTSSSPASRQTSVDNRAPTLINKQSTNTTVSPRETVSHQDPSTLVTPENKQTLLTDSIPKTQDIKSLLKSTAVQTPATTAPILPTQQPQPTVVPQKHPFTDEEIKRRLQETDKAVMAQNPLLKTIDPNKVFSDDEIKDRSMTLTPAMQMLLSDQMDSGGAAFQALSFFDKMVNTPIKRESVPEEFMVIDKPTFDVSEDSIKNLAENSHVDLRSMNLPLDILKRVLEEKRSRGEGDAMSDSHIAEREKDELGIVSSSEWDNDEEGEEEKQHQAIHVKEEEQSITIVSKEPANEGLSSGPNTPKGSSKRKGSFKIDLE